MSNMQAATDVFKKTVSVLVKGRDHGIRGEREGWPGHILGANNYNERLKGWLPATAALLAALAPLRSSGFGSRRQQCCGSRSVSAGSSPPRGTEVNTKRGLQFRSVTTARSSSTEDPP